MPKLRKGLFLFGMKVINIKTSGERYDVFIGRPSKWGNPFTHLQHLGGPLVIVDTREEAVARYEEWLMSQPELVAAAKKELRGKVLGCFCSPLSCHGDVLLKVANS
jgi:hypothetical protein